MNKSEWLSLSFGALALAMTACSSTDAPATPVAGDGGGGGRGGGDGDEGSGRADAGIDPGFPTVKVSLDVAIPNAGGSFPHKVDVYAPSNSTATVVFLHGGGGNKTKVADALGVAPDGKVDEAWLLERGLTFVFPQGQALPGSKATTWSNYTMTSGQNDVAFLEALAKAIRAGSIGPATARVYIAGHSNGGIMANRMWCEAPTTFDAYGAIAGPPSKNLHPTLGAAPCAPSVVRPYLGIIGDADSVLGTAGKSDTEIWTVQTAGSPSFVDPDLVNERFFHAVRVKRRCNQPPSAPTISGPITRFNDCGGAEQVLRIAGGDHPISELETAGKFVTRNVLAEFFRNVAP